MKYNFINTYDVEIWKQEQELLDNSLDGFSKPRTLPRASLNFASSLFNKIEGKTIVECGTGLQGEVSGNSMLYWFHKTTSSIIHCIDLDSKWVQTIKDELGNDPRIEYHIDDCFEVVPKIEKIDLIYMDFWVGDAKDREKAYVELYRKSNHPKLILIDDSDHSSPWKQTMIVPAACDDGYRILYIGRQTLLARKDIAEKHRKTIDFLGQNFGR